MTDCPIESAKTSQPEKLSNLHQQVSDLLATAPSSTERKNRTETGSSIMVPRTTDLYDDHTLPASLQSIHHDREKEPTTHHCHRHNGHQESVGKKKSDQSSEKASPQPSPRASTTDSQSQNKSSGDTDITTSAMTSPPNLSTGVEAEGTNLVGTNGKQFVPKGINITTADALKYEHQIQTELPGMNMIRLSAVPGKDSIADIQKVISNYTSKGIVVEVEDHAHSTAAATGSALKSEEQWYAQLASANKDNKDVWFGTPNEPKGTNTAIANEEFGVYDAIRGSGNNSLIMMEEGGGYNQAPLEDNAEKIKSLKNVAGDFHYYYSGTSQTREDNYLTEEVDGIHKLGIPAVLGEFGNAEDGEHVNPLGSKLVDNVINANNSSGLGAIVWDWHNGSYGSEADNMIANSNGTTLTKFGGTIASWMNKSSD